MGCCVSTPLKNTPNSLTKGHQFSSVISKSPPRPEEETVKEVLSETPKPKPEPEPEPEIKLVKNNAEQITLSNIVLSPKKLILHQKLPSLDKKLPHLENAVTPEASEISEVSEMCSLSETISTNTLDEHTVKDCANSNQVHKRVYRSQGQNGHFSNNLTNNRNKNNNNTHLRHHQGRSPARRVDPSPPRRRYPGPAGPGQDTGPKRDNSARRSRSPATRPVGRSPNGKRSGPSPGRVRVVNGKKDEEESNVKAAEENEEGLKESLENPLVSLECFIFL